MKKIIIFMLTAAVMLGAASCSAARYSDTMAGSTVLLSINGQSVVTAQDLKNKMTEHDVSKKYKGTTPLSEKDMFIEMAEYRTLDFMARLYGLADDEDYLYDDYDSHITEVKNNADLYPGEAEYEKALQSALKMTDAEFREWNVHENAIYVNTDLLLDDIGDAHGDITDPTLMDETVLGELQEAAGNLDIKIAYPGLEKYTMTFSTVSTEGHVYTSETAENSAEAS